jgi:hypothetical protein
MSISHPKEMNTEVLKQLPTQHDDDISRYLGKGSTTGCNLD